MTENKDPKSCLRIGMITIAVLIAESLLCRYASLRSNAIALDVPNPPGSQVKTSRHWSGFWDSGYLLIVFASYHVWDRHYQIPSATFDSVAVVERYFDNWLTEHDWVNIEDTSGVYFTSSVCLSRGGYQTDIEHPSVVAYTTQEWLDRPPIKPPLLACLIIEPEVHNGYYLVRLFTLHPTFWYELNM